MIEFPQTQGARARVTAALEALNTFCERAQARGQDPMRLVKHERLYADVRHAVDAGRRQIAEEVLPAILGGRWAYRKRRKPMISSLEKSCDFWSEYHPILDHAWYCRPTGARGTCTWPTVVLMGEPYGDDDDCALESQIDDAGAIEGRWGAATWCHPHLSVWYPGRTVLMITSTRLAGLDPAPFGFRRVAPGLALLGSSQIQEVALLPSGTP